MPGPVLGTPAPPGAAPRLVSRPVLEPASESDPGVSRLRAAGAAGTLLVLLIGAPLALAFAAGWPLPHGIPTLQELRSGVTHQLPWAVVVNALICLAWLAWMQLLLCVFVEVRAALAQPGLGVLIAPRIPLAHLNQALARRLVSTALALVTSSGGWAGTAAVASVGLTPAVAVSGARAPALSSSAPGMPTAMSLDPTLVVSSVSALQPQALVAHKIYVVEPPHGAHFDCLWNIAERYLGDGQRYGEIFALNRGRLQPDGRRLRDEDLIRPGWTLLLPADARGLPDDTRPAIAPPTTPPTPRAERPAPPAAAEPTPTTAAVSPSPSGLSSPSSAVDERRPAAEGSGQLVSNPAALAGGGLLAAGLLLALARLRRAQQRHRRTGRRIRVPGPELAGVEVGLRIVAEPDDLDFLDRGLRTLGLVLGDTESPLPCVAGARLAEDSLQLLLSSPAPDAPAPFVASEGGEVWTLRREARLPDDQLAEVLCPKPALVPIGRDDKGLVLLDLEAAGVTSLVGAPEDVAPVIACIVAELAVSSWADYLQVTLVGFGEQLVRFDPERVIAVDELDEMRIRQIAARLDAVRTDGASADDGVVANRVGRGTGEAWMPEFLVLANSPTEEFRRTVLQALPATGRSALAILVAGDCPDARLRLRLAPDGTIEVPSLGLTVRANRLEAEATALLPALLDTARDLRDVPPQEEEPGAAGDLGHDAPDDGRPVREEEAMSGEVPAVTSKRQSSVTGVATPGAAPQVPSSATRIDPTLDRDITAYLDPNDVSVARVGVMGPVVVHAAGPVTSNRRVVNTELVAYLATHPRGVAVATLDDAIWPENPDPRRTRIEAVARTRKWLGTDAEGNPHLPASADGTLRLGPGVLLDWALFQRLQRRAVAAGAAGAEDLRTALRLIRGRPFENLPPGRYSWLSETYIEQDIPPAVIDVAHKLARHCLDAGRPTEARDAARAAQLVDRYDERPWRDLMEAEYAVGNVAGVRALFQDLLRLLDADGDDLTEETSELVARLLPGLRSAG